MAEVRCPMCSGLNPADQEVCQYCLARLKPLQAQASTGKESVQPPDMPASAGKGDSTPGPLEWWQALHDDSDEKRPSPAKDQDDDWIRNLRDRPLFEESPDHGEVNWPVDSGKAGGAEAETSDWLSRIRGEAVRGRYGDADAQEPDHLDTGNVAEWLTHGDEAEAPDWLTGVETPGESLASPDEYPEETPLEGRTDLPDWLLPADEQASLDGGVLAKEPAEQGEGLPDWLTGMPAKIEEPVPVEGKTGLTGMLGWLEDQPEEMPGGDETETPTVAAGEPEIEDIPAWLLEESAADEAERLKQEGTPDWLLEQETQAERSVAVEGLESVDLPDWLKEETPAAAAASTEGADLEGGEIPDWLLQETQRAEEPSAEAVEPEAGELPDWMEAELLQAAEPPAAEAAEPEGEAPPKWPQRAVLAAWMASNAAESPDWLAEVEAGFETPVGEPSIQPGSEEVPDWLASSAEELPDWLAGEEAATPVPTAEGAAMPDWLGVSQQEADSAMEPLESLVEDDVHDIMASLSRQTAASDPGLVLPEDEQVEEDLSWLTDLESTYPDIGLDQDETSELPEGGEPPFDITGRETEVKFDEELPAWLSGAVIEEGAGEAAGQKTSEDLSQGELEAGLTPAELPSWLEAMRPVESVAAAVALIEEDAEEEGAGPLAGLKGVLKAEPDISYARRPPAYSVKLQAGESQLANAELLRKLIETEGEAQPIPSAPVITSLYVLRITIFILLVLSVLTPLILGVPQLTLPMTPTTSADALVVSQLVAGVPPGAPVLLAFDYEPGLSGEMDLYTGVVLEHLMSQGAFLTLVSISPTGPLQAERLLMEVNRSGNYQYSAPNNYLNLGFVPGGPAGLLSFAMAPQRIMPLTLDGRLAWQGTAIAGFQDLAQFALIVVATENPDTARTWIEQVQPRIGSTPMLLVASAQTEPVVWPYYEGRPQQVQGLLSGPAASGIYTTLVPSISQKDAQVFWTPFSIGVWVGSALILVGSGLNAFMVLFKRRNENKEGEQ